MERPNKRARNATACTRCKHRKQRCDNAYPACAACSLAGKTCHYEKRIYSAEHVEALEKRVVDLECQLRQSRQQGSHHQRQQDTPPTTGSLASTAIATATSPNETNETDAAFEMLSSTSYLGTSSGFPLSRTLQAAIGPAVTSPSQPTNSDSPSLTKPASPDSAMGLHFVNTYLCKVHPKHAFLSPRRLLNLHHSCRTLALSARPAADSSASNRIDFFVLHLVYAVGARYMQLSQNEYHCNPEAYYAAAIEDVECLFEVRTLESLEGMLLLCIFQLRSPSRPGIWSMTGMAMRHALVLGLHRKYKGSNIVDQRRKRIFWTIYMLERSIARTLGLPVCISDRDIEIELPENVPEDIEDETSMSTALQHSAGASAMSASIHIFRLARLESKIYSSIHRVDRPASEVSPHKISRLRQLLDDWKNQISSTVPSQADIGVPPPNSYVSPQYHTLHYHRVVLLLLLPNLTTLAPTSHDFHLCVSSAGKIARLYKQLHDHQNMLSYSLIALHATFVAGLTLVYCFLAAQGTIFSPQFSSDIRACSTVLYIISERWPAARRIRDAFERMVSLTVERDERTEEEVGCRDIAISSQNVDVQTGSTMTWQDLTSQMPGSPSQQDSCLTGGAFADPNNFWNCLGPWLGTEDILGQEWLDVDFEGSSSTIPLMHNGGWSL